jgi:RNA polymerase sigma factor (sigma-70 family)
MSDPPADLRARLLPRSSQLDELFRREAPRLLAFLKRRTGDVDTASDLLQESFARIARLPSLAHIGHPAAYLQRIARNLLIDRHRQKEALPDWRHEALCEDCDIAIPASQEAEIEAKQMLRLYETALSTLSDRSREIFLLSRRDGLTYKQIQAATGLCMGTVEYHMMRAIAHIDRYFDAHG